jgi:hypothetical protein
VRNNKRPGGRLFAGLLAETVSFELIFPRTILDKSYTSKSMFLLAILFLVFLIDPKSYTGIRF